jgi:hypothetical protein
MQHSPAPSMRFQLSLQLVQYASYSSLWHPKWTHQYTQLNYKDVWTLLESPPYILELEDVIPIVVSFYTSYTMSILLCRLAGNPENGQSDSLQSSRSIIQEEKQFVLGRSYRGHRLYCAYTRPTCYELPEWSVGWHSYILPCSQVSDTQQK